MRDIYKVHEGRYKILRSLFMPLICRIFNFTSGELPREIQGPFLITANHNTDLDPVLISAASNEHMYFVASEHVLRGGPGAFLLKKLFAPIARMKGATDASCAMTILRKLRGGANVCLFAEGNRSFDGLTGPVFPATGKMVKAAGCSLVTYRFEGGYFTSPRWSVSLRRGRMRGNPVRVFSPEQLKGMSAEEINEAIARDICEDAYARQAEEETVFHGRKLAEKLETALFICPSCGRIGKMSSGGDRLSCECGMSARYDEKGYLHGVEFDTVTQWDRWQREKLKELAETGDYELHDEGVTLLEIESEREKCVSAGDMRLSDGHLKAGDFAMKLDDIQAMALIGRNRIMLTHERRHYEIRAGRSFCARKYALLYEFLKREGR